MSANSTVTSFRSVVAAADVSPSAAPHVEQNRASGSAAAPQVAHVRPSADPHVGQNRASADTVAPQVPHVVTARV
jgi:hypothetical protein